MRPSATHLSTCHCWVHACFRTQSLCTSFSQAVPPRSPDYNRNWCSQLVVQLMACCLLDHTSVELSFWLELWSCGVVSVSTQSAGMQAIGSATLPHPLWLPRPDCDLFRQVALPGAAVEVTAYCAVQSDVWCT